jgi:predicted O-methyltransferase YrrM
VSRQLAALLEQLHRDGVEHDSSKSDRLERLRNLEPGSAALLALLVRATGARAVLELGTSNGYSTLWLADALRDTGGRLVSVEIDRARSELAAENLQRAGLRALVQAEQRLSEALVPSGAGVLLVVLEASAADGDTTGAAARAAGS